jgi:O6-methylguanine-DNA--protein-cysteine methyltransferase
MDIAAFILKTDLGWIGVSGTEKGLRQFILPQSSFSEVCLLLGIELKPEAEIPTVLTDIIERLKLYLKGYQTAFPDRLDLSKGTEFQRRVWEITRLIPYGETRSYS